MTTKYSFDLDRCSCCGCTQLNIDHGDNTGFNTSGHGPFTTLHKDYDPSNREVEAVRAIKAALEHPNGGDNDKLIALAKRWGLKP